MERERRGREEEEGRKSKIGMEGGREEKEGKQR